MSEGQTVFILNPKHEQFPAGREWLMQDNVTKTRFAIQTLISFGVMFLAALIFYVFASSPTLDFTKVFFGGIPVGLFALATLIRILPSLVYQLYAEVPCL